MGATSELCNRDQRRRHCCDGRSRPTIMTIIIQRILRVGFWLGAILPAAVRGAFLSKPIVRWSYRIPGSGGIAGRGLRRGNGVAVSSDESRVFATADDGSLHIINPHDLNSTVVYQPERLQGSFPECRSGVVLNEGAPGGMFAVYTVNDFPAIFTVSYGGMGASTSPKTMTSRIVAVDVSGAVRWSISVDGYTLGTPVLGADGDKIYVTHNREIIPGRSYRGRVTIISDAGGNAVVLSEHSLTNRPRPYGPPGIQTDAKGRDVLVWAESNGDGFEEGHGQLYGLVQQKPGGSDYAMTILSDWPVASITPPIMSPSLDGLWMGGFGSSLVGWEGSAIAVALDSEQQLNPAWGVQLPTKPGQNASTPITAPPVLSSDADRLYVPGNFGQLYCLSTQGGETLWSVDGQGVLLAAPKLSETTAGSVVYVAESPSGTIRQYDATSGALKWESSCTEISEIEGCEHSVEADLYLSSNGDHLYYGDIMGTIVSLEVASFDSSPTITTVPPTTASPTTGASVAPSGSPTLDPVAASPPPTIASMSPSAAPSLSSSTSLPTTTSLRPSTATPSTASPVLEPTVTPTVSSSSPTTLSPEAEAAASPTESPEATVLDEPGVPDAQSPTLSPSKAGGYTLLPPSTHGTGGSAVPTSPSEEESPIPSAENATALSPSSATGVGFGDSALKDATESSPKGTTTIVMIILVIMAFALVVVMSILGFLWAKRRRKRKEKEWERARKKASKKAWKEKKQAFDKMCEENEAKILEEISTTESPTPSPPNTPDRKQAKPCNKHARKASEPLTPSTLGAIVEGDNEEASVASTTKTEDGSPEESAQGVVRKSARRSFASSSSRGNDSVENDAEDEELSRYLPRSLRAGGPPAFVEEKLSVKSNSVESTDSPSPPPPPPPSSKPPQPSPSPTPSISPPPPPPPPPHRQQDNNDSFVKYEWDLSANREEDSSVAADNDSLAASYPATVMSDEPAHHREKSAAAASAESTSLSNRSMPKSPPLPTAENPRRPHPVDRVLSFGSADTSLYYDDDESILTGMSESLLSVPSVNLMAAQPQEAAAAAATEESLMRNISPERVPEPEAASKDNNNQKKKTIWQHASDQWGELLSSLAEAEQELGSRPSSRGSLDYSYSSETAVRARASLSPDRSVPENAHESLSPGGSLDGSLSPSSTSRRRAERAVSPTGSSNKASAEKALSPTGSSRWVSAEKALSPSGGSRKAAEKALSPSGGSRKAAEKALSPTSSRSEVYKTLSAGKQKIRSRRDPWYDENLDDETSNLSFSMLGDPEPPSRGNRRYN